MMQSFGKTQTFDEVSFTFVDWGKFSGDWGPDADGCSGLTCSRDAANAPWAWDDGDDGPVYAGAMALNPARLFKIYFVVDESKVPSLDRSAEPFAQCYVRNPYIEDLDPKDGTQDGKFTPPADWPKLDLGEMCPRLGARLLEWVTRLVPRM